MNHQATTAGFAVFGLLGCVLTITAPVALTIRDEKSPQPMPGRIPLCDAAGRVQRGGGLPFWFDHFVYPGKAEMHLRKGSSMFEVERAPEFSVAKGGLTLAGANGTNLTVTLSRIADLAAEGWWSGQTHEHRGGHDVQLLMRAEALRVGQFIAGWNKANPWTNAPLPKMLPIKFHGNRFYHLLGGDDEDDGGALLYLDLRKPIDITDGSRHFPTAWVYAKHACERGVIWIDAQKPFWWDFPLWVGLGPDHFYDLYDS